MTEKQENQRQDEGLYGVVGTKKGACLSKLQLLHIVLRLHSNLCSYYAGLHSSCTNIFCTRLLLYIAGASSPLIRGRHITND